ncbi:MAG TPA: HEAT repeat domain-containing protein, partial [Ktedonobacterales bacterium]
RWPFWMGGVVTLVAFALLVADARPTLVRTWETLLRDPGQVGLGATLAITLALALPLLAGATAAFLAWQCIRLLQLARYLGALHAAAGSRLERAAPLTRLGYLARGVPFTASGVPGAEEVKLATILSQARGVLVLGDDGAGKTTALHEYAHALSSRRNLLAIAFGRRPLPIMLPLEWFARRALGMEDPRSYAVAQQLWAFGAGHLAARAPSALRHWNVALLCDGLDEVPAVQRAAVAEHIGEWRGIAYPEARVIISCALSAYLAENAALASLSALERVVLTGVRVEDVPRLLRHSARSARARAAAARYAAPETSAYGLGGQIGHPATLAAVLAVAGANQSAPPGRGHLLRAYADVLCARAGDDVSAARLRLLLETVAGALRANESAALPVPRGASAATAVREWLQRTANAATLDMTGLTPVVETALRLGVLEQPRGAACVRFVARDVEAVFAALALERLDQATPDRPLPPDLLAPHWREPALLWAGFTSDPGRLIERLLGLRSDSDRATAGITVPALALAATLEACAPALAAPRAPDDAALAAKAPGEAERHLRRIFDEVGQRVEGTEARQALVHELAVIERQGQVDLTAHLVTVARSGALGRLVRAQAIELLGGIATPASLDGLVALLPETDAVLRGAVDRAFAALGALALPRLQRALGSEDERLRLRALEALGQGSERGISAVVAATASEVPQDRETAARALGALKALEGVPALAALLDDRAEAVRLAAAEALGYVRARAATTALIAHAGTAQVTQRAAIAAALGATQDAAALDTLLALLGDTAPPVRRAAAEALGKLGSEQAVRQLRERLDDPDAWVRAAAATALRRLGHR